MRLSKDAYFMGIAEAVSLRSTCLRRQTGAVTVDSSGFVVSTGYNGAPTGMEHCLDRGCIRDAEKIPSGEQAQICRAVHAEQNALLQAEDMGRVRGSTCYCLIQPCVICAKMLITTGVLRVVYVTPYPDQMAADMLADAGVKLERF